MGGGDDGEEVMGRWLWSGGSGEGSGEGSGGIVYGKDVAMNMWSQRCLDVGERAPNTAMIRRVLYYHNVATTLF